MTSHRGDSGRRTANTTKRNESPAHATCNNRHGWTPSTVIASLCAAAVASLPLRGHQPAMDSTTCVEFSPMRDNPSANPCAPRTPSARPIVRRHNIRPLWSGRAISVIYTGAAAERIPHPPPVSSLERGASHILPSTALAIQNEPRQIRLPPKTNGSLRPHVSDINGVVRAPATHPMYPTDFSKP
mmetsp:Transcript_16844/g.32910  ORF Transcript_16844/g.32910 Transcript_16844/m.32910 type:complete len:185 (-) Transcript_16844:120-674(-)